MTEKTVERPKEYFATENLAWVHILQEYPGLNAEMVVSTDHIQSKWRWTVDLPDEDGDAAEASE